MSIEEFLNEEIETFPTRAGGEELFRHIRKISYRGVEQSREEFSKAMLHWLSLRAEPKTMLAVELIGLHQLTELREELETLLYEVSEGLVFHSFYDKPILKTLSMI